VPDQLRFVFAIPGFHQVSNKPMGLFEKFTFPENKLIAFYLGGRAPKCNIELHDVIFLVGKDSDELVPQIKEKWFGSVKTLHVDSWYAVENVDGYDVELVAGEKKPSDLKLYFVNLGAYEKGGFGERHYMKFIVAESVPAAKALAKKSLSPELVEPHTDDLYDVDDCVELEKVGNYSIQLKPGKKTNAEPINGWQRVL
jgi:hypothetical protein